MVKMNIHFKKPIIPLDLLLIILILGSITMYCILWKESKVSTIIKVQEKWIKASGSDQQSYLFSDADNNVYQITDEPIYFIWDASDRWAKIQEGKTYMITTIGWRIRFLSWYPNAIRIRSTELG